MARRQVDSLTYNIRQEEEPMPTTMSLDNFLSRVLEIKGQSAAKDEVIAEQQRQIHELESEVSGLEGQYRELEEHNHSLQSSVNRTNEMLEQLAAALV